MLTNGYIHNLQSNKYNTKIKQWKLIQFKIGNV